MVRTNLRLFLIILTIILVSSLLITPLIAAPPAQAPDHIRQLIQKAQTQGTVRVIIGLDIPFQAEGKLANQAAVQTQRQAISTAQDALLQRMQAFNLTPIARYQFIPFMAVEVDATALAELASLPEVTSIAEDVPVPADLASATQVIGADQAWANGYTGVGQVVAILDTGVDKTHPFFTTGGNKVISEACYSTTFAPNNSVTVCPGGVEQSTAVGSGIDCTAVVTGYPGAISGCQHGTHVAGIAAGNDGGTNIGVARDADIIAIQVFSLFTGLDDVRTYTNDQILGLERVYALRNTYNIAAANMSLGGGQYFSVCDTDPFLVATKAAIDNLLAAGIATIISSGNEDYRDSTGAPGCISTAVTVGATEDDDDVADFSNIAPFVDLLAPGVDIVSSIPGGETASFEGTSMSAPMTTGAWAVMRAITPTATVNDLLTIFQNSATLVDDNRSLGIETDMPRINLDMAIDQLVTALTVNKTAPTQIFPGETLTYTIGIFNETAVAANSVVITDIVPANTTLDLASLSGGGSASGTASGSLITWNTGSNLLSGQGLTRTFRVTVDSSATDGGIIINEAHASASNFNGTRLGTASTAITRIAQCGFSDGFESGALSDYWRTHTTNEGRVRVTSSLAGIAPHGGSYHAILDDSVALSSVSESGIILTLDLTGQTGVDLDFWWVENQDEYDPGLDGVFISDDYGATWYQAFAFSGDNPPIYSNAIVDIDAAASSNGLTLNDHFQIKFQFYDNYPFEGNDGYGIDDVQITCAGPQLSISKGVVTTNTPAQSGEMITYTVTVSNSGNQDATGVRITDTLPTHVNGTDLDQTVTVTASDQVIYVFTATVDAGAPYDQTITNTAYFSHTSRAGSDNATFTTSANQAPQAADDTYQVDEDNTLTILATGVLSNDIDLDPLTATAQTLPLSGTLDLNLDGSFVYTPSQHFNGQDSFEYVASDGALTDTATVTITVTAVDDAPQADDDTYTIDEDSLNNLLDVLSGDTDADGDTLSIAAIGPLDNGGSAVISGNQVEYNPASNFNGTEVFTYTVSDSVLTDTATVTVTVTPQPDAPVITEGDAISVTMDEDSSPTPFSLTLNATDVESDTLTWSISGQAGNGTASATGSGLSKSIGYTPTAHFFGGDAFVVQVSDGGLTDTIVVSVTVTPQNDDPNAVDDSFSVDENSTTVTLPVLDNDDDAPDTGETLTIIAVGVAPTGTVSISSTNTSLTYSAAPGQLYTEAFTYTIDDGNGGRATAAVTVTVDNVNNAPDAFDDTFNVLADSSNNLLDVLSNDSDQDLGDLLSISAVGPTNNGGTASISGTTTIVYTPALSFSGQEVFTYTASDGALQDTATVTAMVIASANSAPSVADQAFGIVENSPNGSSLGTIIASDPNGGQTLAYTIIVSPANNPVILNSSSGELTVSDSSLLDFETQPVFSLTVEVIDNGLPPLTDTALITISLNDVNEAPTLVTPIPDQIALAASPFTYTVPAGTFTDPDAGDTISLTAVLSGSVLLPGWLSFDSLTETFSGTPDAADVGSHSIQVQATDSGLLSVSDDFTIFVMSGDPQENVYLPVVIK